MNLRKFFIRIFFTVLFIGISGGLILGQYKVNKNQLIGWSVLGFTGIIDGSHTAYTYNNRLFEQKFGSDPTGFFGSQSWRRLYDRPNFYNENFGVFNFDHIATDLKILGYISGGIIIGLGEKKKFKYYLYDFIISVIVISGTKRLTFELMRM